MNGYVRDAYGRIKQLVLYDEKGELLTPSQFAVELDLNSSAFISKDQFLKIRSDLMQLQMVFNEIEKAMNQLGTMGKETFRQIKEQGGM